MIRPAERRAWLLQHLQASSTPLDILDSEFVDAYIKETAAPFDPMPYGAHRCTTLGRDLAAMFKDETLQRQAVGIPCGYEGMPRWVYAYEVAA